MLWHLEFACRWVVLVEELPLVFDGDEAGAARLVLEPDPAVAALVVRYGELGNSKITTQHFLLFSDTKFVVFPFSHLLRFATILHATISLPCTQLSPCLPRNRCMYEGDDGPKTVMR